MLLARTIALILVVAAWSGLAGAQVQVEPVPPQPVQVPAFDMFDLDATQDPSIQLPAAGLPQAEGAPGLESVEIQPPAGIDANDPCRHFTDEERRLLPTLCGTSD